MVKKIEKNAKITLSEWGLVQISGKDAKSFLQGQLTCNLEEINEKHASLGANCGIQGRVQASFRLFFYHDNYYMFLPLHMVQHLLNCLKKYALFSKVTLENVSHEWKIIALIGPTLAELLAKQQLLPSLPSQNLIAYNQQICLSIDEMQSRFLLLYKEPYAPAWINQLESKPSNEWLLQEIKAGIVSIFPETAGKFTPEQLNYPSIGAVSFDKGCYIGQEIVARMHYLGKSKSKTYQARFHSSQFFPSGTVLKNSEDQSVGTLLLGAEEASEDFLALACLQNTAISHTIYVNQFEGPILTILE